MSNQRTQRLTMAQATAMQQEDWEWLEVRDLDLTVGERQRAAAVWLWLCGVDPKSKEAAEVGNEALVDGELTIALSAPAAELFTWFRKQDWGCFCATERTGSEAWGWAALRRMGRAVEAQGLLASQCPLVVLQD